MRDKREIGSILSRSGKNTVHLSSRLDKTSRDLSKPHIQEPQAEPVLPAFIQIKPCNLLHHRTVTATTECI